MLAAYRDGAPLVARPDRALLEDSLFRTGFFGLLGVDNVLLGQGVPARILTPDASAIEAFERWTTDLRSLLARALPQREALDAYTRALDEGRGSRSPAAR